MLIFKSEISFPLHGIVFLQFETWFAVSYIFRNTTYPTLWGTSGSSFSRFCLIWRCRQWRRTGRSQGLSRRASGIFRRLFIWYPAVISPSAVQATRIEWLSAWVGTLQESSWVISLQAARKKSTRPVCKSFILPKAGPDVCGLFSEDNRFVYCNNIAGLLSQLGITLYTPADWRLFLDSSKRSLKCVLLHNGNVHGAVPVGHSVHLREEHNDIKMVIDLLRYHEHNWIICVDLNMVNFLLGQQHGFMKVPCYLCMWDSRARDKHWTQKEWPIRETLEAGMPNILHDPIVSRDKIIFPPLHIKLGLMKQSVKAVGSDGKCF